MIIETPEGFMVKLQYSSHGPFTTVEQAEKYQNIYETIESICAIAQNGYPYSVEDATEYIMSL